MSELKLCLRLSQMSLKNLIHHFPHFLITLISCENDVYKSEIVADFLGELFSLRRSIMSTSGNMFSNIFQLIASLSQRMSHIT